MQCIGEEPPLEQLAIVPAKQFVIRHIRKKYACRCKRCIKRADMPRQPIPKSQASPQLLAFLMVSKFLDGLPLYRLEKIVARYGLQLSRQNMARWLIQSSEHFNRLLYAFERKLLDYDIALADETRLQVLNEPGRDPTSKSWLWIRRGGPPDHPVILVDYDPSRAAKVPNALFADFKNGYLVADAYAGYAQIAAANNLKLVGCHDHARRKFKDAYDSLSVKARQTKGGIARQAIKRYKLLYKIERELKDKTPEVKKQLRQEKSLPLLKDFKAWLMVVKQQGIAHDKTLTAINYFINQYDTLVRYCEDGRLPISNILSEHVAKSIAIARKNFLFANTQSGAIAAAKIYSIILTAAQNGLEPIGYLTAVLTKMPNIKGNESIEHLLPWNLSQEQLNQYLASMPGI
jgi:transposase